jgi:hypothetical protein
MLYFMVFMYGLRFALYAISAVAFVGMVFLSIRSYSPRSLRTASPAELENRAVVLALVRMGWLLILLVTTFARERVMPYYYLYFLPILILGFPLAVNWEGKALRGTLEWYRRMDPLFKKNPALLNRVVRFLYHINL